MRSLKTVLAIAEVQARYLPARPVSPITMVNINRCMVSAFNRNNFTAQQTTEKLQIVPTAHAAIKTQYTWKNARTLRNRKGHSLCEKFLEGPVSLGS